MVKQLWTSKKPLKGLWVEMERAHIFLARAELELPKSSPSRARALDLFIIEPCRASFKQAHADVSNHHAYILPITKLKHHQSYNLDQLFHFQKVILGKNADYRLASPEIKSAELFKFRPGLFRAQSLFTMWQKSSPSLRA